MPRALLIFVDGLGIGARAAANPLTDLPDAAPLAVFQNEEPVPLFDGKLVRTDARLGVDGRPQSASGQTTILTGVNAPAHLGYHKQGFPNAELRAVLREHSIFLQLKRNGIDDVTFANAYTPNFFTTRPRWVSATTVAVEAAAVPFRTLDDLQRGEAVFMDFTNRFLIECGLAAPELSPEQAGHNLAQIVRQNSFTLYEFFLTDKAGHAQDYALAQRLLISLARMIRATLEYTDLTDTLVMLTSDHGNIEDLSVRTHTLNDVPTWVWGRRSEATARRIKSLVDITPALIESLTTETQFEPKETENFPR